MGFRQHVPSDCWLCVTEACNCVYYQYNFNYNPVSTDDFVSKPVDVSVMVSLLAAPLGDGLCVSRKGKTGGGGWVQA